MFVMPYGAVKQAAVRSNVGKKAIATIAEKSAYLVMSWKLSADCPSLFLTLGR